MWSVGSATHVSGLCCARTPFSFDVDRCNGQPPNNKETCMSGHENYLRQKCAASVRCSRFEDSRIQMSFSN
jgi:hypothetical protein